MDVQFDLDRKAPDANMTYIAKQIMTSIGLDKKHRRMWYVAKLPRPKFVWMVFRASLR